MQDGQAQIDPERCVACGTCVRECPQQAKAFRDDLDRAKQLLAAGDTRGLQPGSVVCGRVSGLAASRVFPRPCGDWDSLYVGETADRGLPVGAGHGAVRRSRSAANHVCTACPAVVRYVETYRSELLPQLVPVVSPMVAHARHIRRQQGEDVRVVFIGPCVAKKAEAERPEVAGAVDVVLTFRELAQWLKEARIDLNACEESDFDEPAPGDARLFALEGGAVKTAGIAADLLSAVGSGGQRIRQCGPGLGRRRRRATGRIVEPLFCAHGCVNGPAMPDERNAYQRRDDVLDFAGDLPSAATRPVAALGVAGRSGVSLQASHATARIDRSANSGFRLSWNARENGTARLSELRGLRLCRLPRKSDRRGRGLGRTGDVHAPHAAAWPNSGSIGSSKPVPTGS